VGELKVYATVSEYADGRPGEIFMTVAKQGSTLSGVLDAWAIAVSLGLQYGVPLESYARKYIGQKFEPFGMTDDGEVKEAQSVVDYVFRRLALDYLSLETRHELGVIAAE
jgi:ribonucleoside-diphosphate reductase alpha chain